MSSVAATKTKTYDLAYIAIFAVVMAVCSWISIPMTVPFTLQTFGVFMAVGVLGGKRNPCCSCIHFTKRSRCTGICRIFRRYRGPVKHYRRLYRWIPFFSTGNVGH